MWLNGPAWPASDIDSMMIAGLTLHKSLYPSAALASAPGRMFSTTTSQVAASLRICAWSSALFISSMTLRLP